jgi:flagellar secretion chaperone FliS
MTAYAHSRTRAAYQSSAVLTATQGQLIVMLYDGANRFLNQAAVAMRSGNIEIAHQKLRRAEMIISHLRASLDFDRGGQIAPDLLAIYVFCTRHLNSARVGRDPEKIEQVAGLLSPLRDAWAQVSA